MPSTYVGQLSNQAQAADLRGPLAELVEAKPLNLTTLIPISNIFFLSFVMSIEILKDK